MNTATHIFVSGIVQGVCFRAFVYENARAFNVNGWVRNLNDGRVEAFFEGSKKNIDKMIELCKIGPSGAKVTNIDINDEIYTGKFKDFTIQYRG
ncbi:MAG: acylphosphatase [Candidatus Firestonebacteria bacterium]